MRITRTWTISLPPQLDDLAQHAARKEHRTKSELVREALRHYLSSGGGVSPREATSPLSQAGALAEVYRQHTRAKRASEAELRKTFYGVRRLHDRLKHLAL